MKHFIDFGEKRRGVWLRAYEAARSLMILLLTRFSPRLAAAAAHERGAWGDGKGSWL